MEHSLSEQWNPKQCPVSSQPLAFRPLILGISQAVLDVNRAALKHGSSCEVFSAWRRRVLLIESNQFGRGAPGDRDAEPVSVWSVDESHIRTA